MERERVFYCLMEKSENTTAEKLKKTLEQEYIGIENRSDIPDDEKVSRIESVGL